MKTFLRLYGSDLAQLLTAVSFLVIVGLSSAAALRKQEVRDAARRPDVKTPMLSAMGAAPVTTPPVRKRNIPND